MSLYPYEIFIKDPDLIHVLKITSVKRAAPISSPNVSKKLGYKVRPIRNDILLGPDSKYTRGFIGLTPNLKLDFKQIGKGYKFIFDFDF